MPNEIGLLRGVLNGQRWLMAAGTVCLCAVASATVIPNLFPFLDPTGLISTYNTAGPIDQSSKNPFFESLGTNGRTCGTCHLAGDAMGLSLHSIRAKYFVSHGNDPLFAAIDGANCPNTTSLDPAAHSLLLKNGLIRIGLQLPSTGVEFQISAYRDPYGCAVVTDPTSKVTTVSVYRRPLPRRICSF